MADSFLLDGLQLNDGTTFGVLVEGLAFPPPKQRREWIGAADSEAQVLVRDPLYENREITIPVAVLPQANVDLVFDKIGLVVDKLVKASKSTDGITLAWVANGSARTINFDVLAGELPDLPLDFESGFQSLTPQFNIVLTCKPYWRGTETLTSTASSSSPFVTLAVTNSIGDAPALGRLIVTDTATQSRRHVEWGLEGPLTYNASTSLLVDSDDMVTTGFAGTQTTFTGSYDPNAAGNNAITAVLWTTPTAVCGTGNLSHVGAFRVKARVFQDVGLVRFSWKVGDGPMASNAWTPVINGWNELDLGTITIPTVLSGTQRWTGQIEGLGISNPFGTMTLDYLVLVPVSDGYGKARGVFSDTTGVRVGYDDFTGTTAAAVLNARVAPAGGTWATSGVATDFTFSDSNPVDATGESVTRATSSEASRRFGILGATNYTDTAVVARVQHNGAPAASAFIEQGVIARWVDANNYLAVYRKYDVSSASVRTRTLVVEQVVAGVATVLGTGAVSDAALSSGTWHTIRVAVYASGRVIATHTTSGSVVASVDASSSVLATAGTLATGKPGILDRSSGAGGIGRWYDDVEVAVPAAEPIAIYSGRNMQIRHDDTFRQDSTGTYTGRPQFYRGSRFLVPVGTSRVLVKARRNDVDEAADANVTDATQIQIGVTPRGLAVPRA